MALWLVGGKNGILVGDEDEGGISHPKLDFLAEGVLDLLRLALTDPRSEEELDTADHD
jgi:hypothetical protein